MNKVGRKLIVCIRCNKNKLHFGRNMCSACLRRTKRETNPIFYLGTCYSEMSRRVKTKTKLRPNYFGMSICTRAEFINRFKNDSYFLVLFKAWGEFGFKRIFAPSVDRVDNTKGYEINNLQFIPHRVNSAKDLFKPVHIKNIDSGEVLEFNSNREAADFIGVHPSQFCVYKKQGKICRGYLIYDPS